MIAQAHLDQGRRSHDRPLKCFRARASPEDGRTPPTGDQADHMDAGPPRGILQDGNHPVRDLRWNYALDHLGLPHPLALDVLSHCRRRMRKEFLSSAFKGHESSTQVTPTDGVMGCWDR
jgi:hypothetical protein